MLNKKQVVPIQVIRVLRCSIAGRLSKELRGEAGLTAFNLAAQSDVSLSTINRMESGRKKEAVTRLTANKVLNILSERLGRRITVED